MLKLIRDYEVFIGRDDSVIIALDEKDVLITNEDGSPLTFAVKSPTSLTVFGPAGTGLVNGLPPEAVELAAANGFLSIAQVYAGRVDRMTPCVLRPQDSFAAPDTFAPQDGADAPRLLRRRDEG